MTSTGAVMYSAQPEPLAQAPAKSIAREWIDARITKPTKAYARSQMPWLMDQLAERCIEESLRLGEHEDLLCERLDNAHEIISSAWHSLAPGYATRWRFGAKNDVSAQEQERIEKAQHILWTRHDPKRAFAEGTRSEHYTGFDKSSLVSEIAGYLSRPYLRHPVLDWIFLDATIS
jgi:hypothetical protein